MLLGQLPVAASGRVVVLPSETHNRLTGFTRTNELILLTCPPDLPRPYCRPSLKPASQSVRMMRSSSRVPLMKRMAFSAPMRV
ncbi:hypothetical protein EYF80_034480 [Liparis tanakae]|uniref:Uncharacterized protein n=1 Tax=Liparis tanakae TaxID=230148 RepID=A0A4Z2GPX7_9TELE|nr:hypothetical protein EYF80_034480 [Liparis tanakae]